MIGTRALTPGWAVAIVVVALGGCQGPPSSAGALGAPDATIEDAGVDAGAGDAPAANLHVQVIGPGVVTSQPPGISCPPACDAAFATAAEVTLIATPAADLVAFTGACSGAVCTVSVVEDVGVRARFAAEGGLLWARRFGGAAGEYLWDVSAGDEGTIAVSGDFYIHPVAEGSGDVGLGPLLKIDGDESFVAAYDADGTPRWAQSIARDRYRITPRHVAVAAGGAVLIAGTFEQQLDLVGSPALATGSGDLFVAAYTAAGVPRWQVPLRTSDADLDLAAMPDGDALVVARVSTDARVGDVVVPVAIDGVLIARLSHVDGAVRWARVVPAVSLGGYYKHTVAVDESGAIFMAQTFSYTVDVGCGGLVAAFGEDVYMARLDGADGACEWSWSYGGDGYDHAGGVAARGGRVAVGLVTNLGFDVGGATAAPWASVAVFQALDGSLAWVRPLGESSSIMGVAIDGTGTVNVAGTFSGTLDIGLPPVTALGVTDVFVARFHDGAPVAVATLPEAVGAGLTFDGYGLARLAAMPEGGAIVGAAYRGTLVVAETSYPAQDVDFVLARFK